MNMTIELGKSIITRQRTLERERQQLIVFKLISKSNYLHSKFWLLFLGAKNGKETIEIIFFMAFILLLLQLIVN